MASSNISLLFAFCALCFISACADEEQPLANTNPEIHSLSAKTVSPGDTLVIYGKNFSPNPQENTVLFQGLRQQFPDSGNVYAPVLRAKSSSLVVIVPQSVITGKVTLRVQNHSASSANNSYFVANNFSPFCTISPSLGREGSVVSVKAFFGKISPDLHVFVGNVPTEILSSSPEELLIRIPNIHSSEFMYVAHSGYVYISSSLFVIDTLPVVSSFQPTTLYGDDTVTITGRNFISKGVQPNATVNGKSLKILEAKEDKIIAQVPRGAGTGKIRIEVNGSAGESAQSINVLPMKIYSYTPLTPCANGFISIFGENFSATRGANDVYVGNRKLTVVEENHGKIIAQIDAGMSGNVTVVTGGETASSTAVVSVLDKPMCLTKVIFSFGGIWVEETHRQKESSDYVVYNDFRWTLDSRNWGALTFSQGVWSYAISNYPYGESRWLTITRDSLTNTITQITFQTIESIYMGPQCFWSGEHTIHNKLTLNNISAQSEKPNFYKATGKSVQIGALIYSDHKSCYGSPRSGTWSEVDATAYGTTDSTYVTIQFIE